jgi:hypothetical protein
MEEKLSGGQPLKQRKRGGDGESMFKLGMTAANLDHQQKEVEQLSLLNMLKEQELRQLKNEILDIIAELERKTQLGEQQLGAIAGTPPMPPGVMPEDPTMMGMPPGMMPPDMGGMSPQGGSPMGPPQGPPMM